MNPAATARCLIAADVDKTILTQKDSEREEFITRMVNRLLDSADLGVHLAFITGNSMPELTNRVLKWLLEELCHTDRLRLLERFHFFCNSGGVYFHFPSNDLAIAPKLAAKGASGRRDYNAESLFEELTFLDRDGKRYVYPRFIDSNYIRRTKILPHDVQQVTSIIQAGADRYMKRVTGPTAKTERYNLSYVTKNNEMVLPTIDARGAKYGSEKSSHEAVVQLTLKPILSFRQGKTKTDEQRLFEHDHRTWLIGEIQRELDHAGLGHYACRAGGRASIDVTLEKLDKAYALEFLIDHLNLQGHTRRGEKFGSNTIYFGDEVIVGGGNDYPVTRIPGLLVFAVNSDNNLVPFLSRVFVPSSIMDGPDATMSVLDEFNKIARALANGSGPKSRPADVALRTALDALKTKIFTDRIRDKIDSLRGRGGGTPDDWQMLHAFVTLMHREDPEARKWLAILVDELDAIMTQIAINPKKALAAIGASRPPGD